MKYKSIIISGPIASGTTTAAKGVSQILKLPFRSAGDFFRQYAIKHKIPLWAKEEIPDQVDRRIDRQLTQLAQKGAVIDSHYAGYFNRNNNEVLKVLLTCDEKERIRRALARIHTHKETGEEIKKRENAHDAKFRKLYADENYLEPKFFDLVIDTTRRGPEEVVEKISAYFSNRV